MNTRVLPLAALTAVVFAGSAAFSHHSAAMFDHTRPVTLVGTVKELQWTNPHAWLEIVVTDSGGKDVQWSIELDGPNSLVRNGWKPKLVAPGDKVTVVANPLRDGRPAGLYVAIELPDGKRLGKQSALPAN